MHTPLSMCSIHHVVEVLPGIWKLDRFLSRSPSILYTFKEAECPTCMQMAREAFTQQFPALYTSPTPLTWKSA